MPDLELTLKEGDTAPEFSAETDGGKRISLAELKGKYIILYFYPRDDTPGCTKEACGFRDAWQELQDIGAVVLGVSTDSVKKHDKFVKKFSLPFPLLADENQSIVTDYGVWGLKKFMGREFMGTHRITFLINSEGKIEKIWPKVKPDQHAQEVLEAIQG